MKRINLSSYKFKSPLFNFKENLYDRIHHHYYSSNSNTRIWMIKSRVMFELDHKINGVSYKIKR